MKFSVALVSCYVFCASLWLAETSRADQNASELPALFDRLRNAESADVASSIENQIWNHWLDGPNENANLLMSQIHQAMNIKNHRVALELSDQLIDSEPEFAEAWNKRATIHYLLGNHAASVADISQTLKLEPRHFGAISGLGLIFLRQNDFRSALQAFEGVLEISPMSRRAQQSVEHVRSKLESEI